jgi:serine/threonine-protein phosphatase 2A activator
MYNAEVLSKFPVVQHFPFGSLFSWEEDPTAVAPPTLSSSLNQPPGQALPKGDSSVFAKSHVPPQEGTRAPWAR